MSNRLHLAKVGPQDGVCLVLFDFVWFCDSVWFYVILFDCLVMSDFVWFSVILFVSVWFSVTLFGYAGVFFSDFRLVLLLCFAFCFCHLSFFSKKSLYCLFKGISSTSSTCHPRQLFSAFLHSSRTNTIPSPNLKGLEQPRHKLTIPNCLCRKLHPSSSFPSFFL